MTALFAKPHSKRLQVLHKLRHVKQGEDPQIMLMTRDTTTGELKQLQPLTDGWQKKRVNLGLGVSSEEFQIAEDLLTEEFSKQVHAVNHMGKTYQIKSPVIKPQGFQRYWRLEIVGAEPQTFV